MTRSLETGGPPLDNVMSSASARPMAAPDATPSVGDGLRQPAPRGSAAREAFRTAAREAGFDPDNAWIDGYVDYEWDHLRPMLQAYFGSIAGWRVLEFGCNMGASSIVMALLGARVDAVDVNPVAVRLAGINAIGHGCSEVQPQHVADTRRLPYADGRFDLVLCNSVLEYVQGDHLAAVQREIARVLSPVGRLMILGTSNRLWPREFHDAGWWNWVPRSIEHRLRGQVSMRGVSPWRLRHGFGPGFRSLDREDAGARYRMVRRGFPEHAGKPLRSLDRLVTIARWLGVSPGLLTPSASIILQRQGSGT